MDYQKSNIMTGDLLINNKDAYTMWGVNMGDGFIEAIYSPLPMKDVIENKSRLQDGKRVIIENRKVDERDLTLTFTLKGASPSDYIAKYKAFLDEITKGEFAVKVPELGEEVYHLYYLRSQSFGFNIARTFSKISVKLNEPNPANRE